ncbi:glycosyltransferase family 4 protein [Maribacter aquivivus]|uniref:glycosyltransferase family 4 protein n=1 Tax=Maribacter aquivivus TaxID=228958 RepID=UPI002492A6C3|nr:glycosyltransferase family 4 protein [Maribacter aquivivus]
MKKILYIMHYPPPIHGAAMMGKYIKESALINEEFNCRYINLSTSIKVDEIGVSGLLKWLRFFSIFFTEFKELLLFRPHLVYFTLTAKGIGFYKDAMLVIAAKFLGFKTIVHFHNKGISSNQHMKLNDVLYKLVFKNTKVILLAPELYQDVEKYVDEKQVYYCSNGIPAIEKIKIVKNRDKHKKDDTSVLLFLSNLIISKGVFVLLESCKLLKDKGVVFQCKIVGGSGDLNESQLMEKISELGLENEVIYLGKKYGEDKIEIFNEASIFVLPTFYDNECFPLVLLEAMQFSLPLVATKEGGIASIVNDGKNGFIVSRKDAGDLARVLQIMIEDRKLRRKLGKKSRKKFKKRYTLETFEENLVSILKQSLE